MGRKSGNITMQLNKRIDDLLRIGEKKVKDDPTNSNIVKCKKTDFFFHCVDSFLYFIFLRLYYSRFALPTYLQIVVNL